MQIVDAQGLNLETVPARKFRAPSAETGAVLLPPQGTLERDCDRFIQVVNKMNNRPALKTAASREMAKICAHNLVRELF